MNILSKLKRLSRRTIVAGVVTAAVISGGLVATRSTTVEAATSCDKVNVIYCGLNDASLAKEINSFQADYDSNTSGHAASPTVKKDYHDVRAIFNYVGASKSLVDSMSTSNTVLGAVQRDGDVVVGGKVIATNAKVAARFSVAGAVAIPGTNAFLRTTTSSFAHASEAAIIRLDGDGNMQFAVIIGCGNAVKATPKVTPKPNYTINKEVAVKGTGAYAKSVKVQPGVHVVYRITVASTGNAPVTNLTVKDTVPAGVQRVANSLMRDGATASDTNFFGDGIVISSLKNGDKVVFTFEAIIGAKDTVQSCTPETLDNVGIMNAPGLPKGSSTATVNKICLPKPVSACTNLTAAPNSRSTFTYTAAATASNGAVITGYTFNFGDGTSQPVATAAGTATAQHTFAAPGTYNGTVSVTVKVGTTSQTITAPACATTVTVKPAPAAECTGLSLKQDADNPRLVTVTATSVTSAGATLTNVSFDWGDSTNTDSKLETTASHTFQKDGSFTVVATLTFSSDSDSVAPSTCSAPVTVTTVMPTCDNLTIDVNNDDKTVTISSLKFTANNGTYTTTTLDWGDSTPAVSASDITGQTHSYTANGPFNVVATTHFTVNGIDTAVTNAACQKPVSFTETPTPPVTPPVTPPTLVNTGAGSVFGIFAAVTAFGTLGYRFFLNRRLGQN